MTAITMSEEEGSDLRYEVYLLIRHPSIDPALITSELQLMPQLAGRVGEPRKSLYGKSLPGVYDKALWSYSVRVNRERAFKKTIAEMIDNLAPHAAFLRQIVETHGHIVLSINLPGDVNIGSSIPWQDLERLSSMKINLGCEVFPEFR